MFYVWTAVFNLFVPSVFWAFMTDIFTRDQGKRLFGIISAGGTLGALTGSLLTATLAEHIQPMFLLFFSVALLELSVVAVRRLSKLSERLRAVRSAPTQEQIIGGSVLAGIRNATSSPYLLGISLYMLLFTTLSTVLYFQLAGIVDRSLADRAARTAFFARVDLLTNGLALVLQLFAFGNLVRVLGLTMTLGVLPAISVGGLRDSRYGSGCGRRRGVPGAEAGRRVRDCAPGTRGAVHRAATRGSLQGEELHRHGRLPAGRSSGGLVTGRSWVPRALAWWESRGPPCRCRSCGS